MFAIYNVKCNNTITLKSIFNFPIQTIIRTFLMKRDKFELKKTTRVYMQDNFLCHVSTTFYTHKTLIVNEEKPSKFSNI